MIFMDILVPVPPRKYIYHFSCTDLQLQPQIRTGTKKSESEGSEGQPEQCISALLGGKSRASKALWHSKGRGVGAHAAPLSLPGSSETILAQQCPWPLH